MESYRDLIEDLANLQFDYKFKPNTRTLKKDMQYTKLFIKALGLRLKEEADEKYPEYANLTHTDGGVLFTLLGDLYVSIADEDEEKIKDSKEEITTRLMQNIADYTKTIVSRDIDRRYEELEAKTSEAQHEQSYWNHQRDLPQASL